MLFSKSEHIAEGMLNALAERQHMLAHNLTNINTVGYVRQDLDFESVMKDLTSHSGHKKVNKMISDAKFEDNEHKATLQEEITRMAENHLKYILMTRLVSDELKGLEEATQSARAG